MNLSHPSSIGMDFEHKLKVKKIAGDFCRQSIFTKDEGVIMEVPPGSRGASPV
jgi:hypothetical protein